MPRKYIGAFARLSADAIKRADYLQLAATSRIGQDYEIEDIEDDPAPEGWTWEEFMSAAEKATAEGRGEEFDIMLAQILGPMIDQVMAQGQEPANGNV